MRIRRIAGIAVAAFAALQLIAYSLYYLGVASELHDISWNPQIALCFIGGFLTGGVFFVWAVPTVAAFAALASGVALVVWPKRAWPFLIVQLLLSILTAVALAVGSFIFLYEKGNAEWRQLIPACCVFLVFYVLTWAAVAISQVTAWVRGARHGSAPLACPSCGFDLRGSRGACPECGRVPSAT